MAGENPGKQQIVEYGPPEEPCKEEKPVCPGDENTTYKPNEDDFVPGEFLKCNDITEEEFAPFLSNFELNLHKDKITSNFVISFFRIYFL